MLYSTDKGYLNIQRVFNNNNMDSRKVLYPSGILITFIEIASIQRRN